MLRTTNKDPQPWGAVRHDADRLQAIRDRRRHRGEIVKRSGGSYRQHRPGQLPPEAREEPRSPSREGSGGAAWETSPKTA